jgi:hypothetical protein
MDLLRISIVIAHDGGSNGIIIPLGGGTGLVDESPAVKTGNDNHRHGGQEQKILQRCLALDKPMEDRHFHR